MNIGHILNQLLQLLCLTVGLYNYYTSLVKTQEYGLICRKSTAVSLLLV